MLDSEPETPQKGGMTFGEGLPAVPEWSELEKLKYEKEALDFYISSHPLAQYEEQLRRYRTHEGIALGKLPASTPVRLAGMITEIVPKTISKGRNQGGRWAIVRVEDFTASFKCIFWSDQYGRFKDDLNPDTILIIDGKVESRDGSSEPDVIVERIMTVEQARRELTREMVLRIPYGEDEELLNKLDGVAVVLKRAKGTCPVFLSVRDIQGKICQLKLGQEYAINPNIVPVEELELILGRGSVLFSGAR
jgi:DNA polymerase III subunit alpha